MLFSFEYRVWWRKDHQLESFKSLWFCNTLFDELQEAKPNLQLKKLKWMSMYDSEYLALKMHTALKRQLDGL